MLQETFLGVQLNTTSFEEHILCRNLHQIKVCLKYIILHENLLKLQSAEYPQRPPGVGAILSGLVLSKLEISKGISDRPIL